MHPEPIDYDDMLKGYCLSCDRNLETICKEDNCAPEDVLDNLIIIDYGWFCIYDCYELYRDC